MRDLVKLVGAAVAGALVAIALTSSDRPATAAGPDACAAIGALTRKDDAAHPGAWSEARIRIAQFMDALPTGRLKQADSDAFMKELATFVHREARAEMYNVLCGH